MQIADTIHSLLSSFHTKLANNTHLKKVLHGAGAVFIIKVAGMALTYVGQIIIARWLGQTEFGIYGYAMTWLYVLAAFATFGLDQTALRFVPEYMAVKNWACAAGMIRYGPRLVAVGATGLSLIAALVVYWMQGSLAPHYVQPLWIVFGMVPFLALIVMRRDIARAFGRAAFAYFPRMVAFPLMTMVGVLVLVTANLRPAATTMLGATLVVLMFIMASQSVILHRSLPREIKQSKATHERRRWLRVSVPLLATVGFRIGQTHTSMLMCGIWLKPDDIAVFFAAERISEAVAFILLAINALGAPKIAYIFAQKNHDELQRLINGLVRWSFWPSLAIAGVLILGSELVLGMFGAAYVSGKWLLAIMVMGNLFSAAVGPVGYLLVMTGHHDSAGWLFGSSTVISILLNASLIPRYGLYGAAYAVSLSIIFRNMLAYFMVKRFTGLHSFAFFQRGASMHHK